MMDLLVKDGRVYTGGRLLSTDIWIRDGRIAALGGHNTAAERIDASGMIIIPGAVDMHVHFRDPGYTHKEDWESGSISAAAGGVTTVVDQPNTDPPVMDAASYREKLNLAKRRSVVDFCLNGGPGDVESLLTAGAAAIGEIFMYEMSDERLTGVLDDVRRLGALATVHAEDGDVIRRYSEPLKDVSDPDVHSRARPPIAEVSAIDRALSASGCRLHICHVSTAEGLELIRRRRDGRVTCEVAPHHLFLSRRDYRRLGTFLKTNPPVRNTADCDALWDGLRRGDVDVLASDHAPHLPEEKRDDIWHAPPGVPGVETMLPLMLYAVKSNMITLERAVDALSARPASILGLSSKGEIAIGKDADLVIFDPKRQERIDVQRLHSRADWTPYEGKKAIFPVMTLVRGIVVFDGDIEVSPGYGRNIETRKGRRTEDSD